MKRALEGQTKHFICLSPSVVSFGSPLSLLFKDFLITIALEKLYSESYLMETKWETTNLQCYYTAKGLKGC